MTYTKDIIESVVTAMKSSGTISSISEVSDVWTITTNSTGNLESGFKVQIGTNYLRCDNVTWNSFTVETTADLSGETTWSMYVNFLFGSKEEISNKLSKEYSGARDVQRFDAIWLLSIIEESIPGESELIDRTDSIVVAIVTDTVKEYTSEEKLTNIFKIRLVPLFELFVSELSKSSSLIINRGENLNIRSNQIYNYYSAKGGNVLNQHADAIELISELKIKKVFTNEIIC